MDYTRESIIESLQSISTSGWISNYRSTSSGNAGNILEDLLGIVENNLPLPDAGEYEIKCQRVKCSPTSLLTLFHLEPEPRDVKVVQYFVKNFGWPPVEWRANYSADERSFRQTINGMTFSDRGFKVRVDRSVAQVQVIFDRTMVSTGNMSWLDNISPVSDIIPHWTFQDLEEKIHLKLKNMFYVLALTKMDNDRECFKYSDVTELVGISFERFLEQIERGSILVDFDARTNRNHGTKFRIRHDQLPNLYDEVRNIV